jgi:hypothetical protein
MRYFAAVMILGYIALMSTCSRPQRASWSDFIAKHPEVVEFAENDDSLGKVLNPEPDTMKQHKEDSLYFGISPGKMMTFTAKSPKSLILPEDAREFLDRAIQFMNRFPESRIEIRSHTDNSGSPQDIEKRANMRAEAVVMYITNQGIDRSRITREAVGAAKPLADNRYEDGRKINNRIEIVVKEK